MTDYPTVRAVSKPAGYDRLLIDGVDVTFWRNGIIPISDYLLTEPFAYGPTALPIPRVAADLEEFGVGELSWIRKNAKVVYQRVDDPRADNPTILATDYRGSVAALAIDGRQLTLMIHGEFSGPASTIIQQQPLVRRVKDVGFWAVNVIERVGLRPSTRTGPVTGVEIAEGGGDGFLDAWAADVCAWSQDDNGVQRAIMPTTWGGNVWGFNPKDTTTKHVTLFTDDARVVPRLRDDSTEVPTTWYGTGIDPDGIRWRNARYPGVFAGPAPTFPGNMSSGDTNADTTTGDGVTVLHEKLVAMGFMSVPAAYGTYSNATARAVKELQDRADLSVTGTVNLATWKALFDVSRTRYSLTNAHIAPLVQDPRVRKFNYTANGSISGLNPLYDPRVEPRERRIDFGPDVTKAQATAWCRAQATRLAGKNLVGTIEINGGFGGFAGEWGPEDADFLNDPATGPAHIMSQRDIRPGMNVWLPMIAGGTLVHVAGVQVNRASRQVILTVDTQARDLLDVAAINARKKDAQRHIRREWFSDNRPAKQSGNMVTADEYFGILDRARKLEGNKWNKVSVVVGQAGQANRVRLRLIKSKAACVVAVLSRDLTRAQMNRRIGNPFTTGPESVWEKESLQEWFENKVILFQAGDGKQPGGYSPRRHRGDDDNVTSAPITGRVDVTATWDYTAIKERPVVIDVWIYPDRDCTLKAGRLIYAQLNDAV